MLFFAIYVGGYCKKYEIECGRFKKDIFFIWFCTIVSLTLLTYRLLLYVTFLGPYLYFETQEK